LLKLAHPHAGGAFADPERALHVVQGPGFLTEVEVGENLADDTPHPKGLGGIPRILDETAGDGMVDWAHWEGGLSYRDVQLLAINRIKKVF
jgi:hypothetical protein